MNTRLTKLNEQFGVLEFPVRVEEMEKILPEFPKTERTYYEVAFKALKKVIKKDEKIYSFNVADPKLTKTGFIVVAEHNLICITMKGGMFGGADAEIVSYKDIKDVDFDVYTGPSVMNNGILYLQMKGMLGGKKRKIRNIPEYNIDSVVRAVRDRISEHTVKA